MITASELAKTLGISRQRVHQYVQAGKLDGCFSGAGSLRRFDLAKSAEALGKRLDPGQLMGNGAATKAVLNQIQTKDSPPAKGSQQARREALASKLNAAPPRPGAADREAGPMAETGAPGDHLPPSPPRGRGLPSGRGAGRGRGHHRHLVQRAVTQ